MGPRVTCKGDPRITPFGHWLRDTKINELPQLWNVLIGEMSLVGPRPEDPDIVKDWPNDAQEVILSLKPGITSPASILYHNEEELLSAKELMQDYYTNILPDKMRLDRLYVKNHSFWSDLDILFWTFAIVIPRMVETQVPEESLFAGAICRFIKRRVSWFVIDLLTSFVIVMGVGVLWRSQGPLDWGIANYFILATVLSLLFSGINTFIGLNCIGWSRATVEDGIKLLIAGISEMMFILTLNTLHIIIHWPPFPPLPTAMLLTIAILAQVGFITSRYRWRLLSAVAKLWLSIRRGAATSGERVLIVGAGEEVETATWLLQRKWLDYAFSIVGIVDDDNPSQYGMRVNGCLVLGKINELPKLIKKHDVGLVLVTLSESLPEVKKVISTIRSTTNVRIVFLDKLKNMIDQQLKYSGFTPNDNLPWNEGWDVLPVYDKKTRLPNKLLFHDRLKHSIAISKRNNTSLAVVHIDLNGNGKGQSQNLRQIRAGQALLCAVVDRLSQSLRECDTLACLGKNEFALILENVVDQNGVQAVTQRISRSLSEPFQIENDRFCLHTQLKYFLDNDIENNFLGNFTTRKAEGGSVDFGST